VDSAFGTFHPDKQPENLCNYKDVKEIVFTQFMGLTGLFSSYSQ